MTAWKKRSPFTTFPLEPEDNGLSMRLSSAVMSLKTPSGIKVTLSPAPPPSATSDNALGFNDVAVSVAVSPNGVYPKSPLQKRVGAQTPLQINRWVEWNEHVFSA